MLGYINKLFALIENFFLMVEFKGGLSVIGVNLLILFSSIKFWTSKSHSPTTWIEYFRFYLSHTTLLTGNKT